MSESYEFRTISDRSVAQKHPRRNAGAEPDIEAATKWAMEALKKDIEAGAFGRSMGHEMRIGDLRRNAFRSVRRKPGDKRRMRVVPKTQFVKEMVRWAREGDPDAHRVACELASTLLKSGDPLPQSLRKYVTDHLDSESEETRSRGRGWDPIARYSRDRCIKYVVNYLFFFGLNRTRSPATERPSACSLVAQVLTKLGHPLSEKTVSAITQG